MQPEARRLKFVDQSDFLCFMQVTHLEKQQIGFYLKQCFKSEINGIGRAKIEHTGSVFRKCRFISAKCTGIEFDQVAFPTDDLLQGVALDQRRDGLHHPPFAQNDVLRQFIKGDLPSRDVRYRHGVGQSRQRVNTQGHEGAKAGS